MLATATPHTTASNDRRHASIALQSHSVANCNQFERTAEIAPASADGTLLDTDTTRVQKTR